MSKEREGDCMERGSSVARDCICRQKGEKGDGRKDKGNNLVDGRSRES